MLKFGIISEINANTGKARVSFEADNIVSGWLPVSKPGTQDDKFYHMPAIGEQVWCMMDQYAEDGVIAGAIYSKADAPGDNVKGSKVTGVQFADGAYVKYDREAGKLTVKIEGAEHHITAGGHTVKRADETLKKIIDSLIDAILAQTHPTGTGPSGTPLNATTFTAIKARVAQLLEA